MTEHLACGVCGLTKDVLYVTINMDIKPFPICMIDQVILLSGGRAADPSMSPTKRGRDYWAGMNLMMEDSMKRFREATDGD